MATRARFIKARNACNAACAGNRVDPGKLWSL